jgi:hypothetical protein
MVVAVIGYTVSRVGRVLLLPAALLPAALLPAALLPAALLPAAVCWAKTAATRAALGT